ncbi:MAG: PoNe immunity protein domain-containing protein [Massilia sp.]
MEKLAAPAFARLKRDQLLDYKIYAENFDEAKATLEEVRAQLEQPLTSLEGIPLGLILEATSAFAWEATDLLSNAYSAGHPLSELRLLYPSVVEAWESYARYSEAYKQSDEGQYSTAAIMPLRDTGYSRANRLICFAILLGRKNLLPRVAPLIDYRNPCKDGMLERLLAPYIADRGPAPSECTRHLPYFKTLKIFNAAPAARPQLMAEYLDEWYHASRREPYHESHKRGISFLGYWSWEAAAFTLVLDIDDASYRDAEFYPFELVEYARQNLREAASGHAMESMTHSLRCKEGEACPLAGQWSSLGIPAVTRFFDEGEIMGGAGAPYGLTLWIWGVNP